MDDTARNALEAILADPYGCPFCDSGKLRGTKPHDANCGFKMAQDALAATPAQAEPPGTRTLIEECRRALSEELSAWDLDPPLHHVKQAHDKCVAWLAAQGAHHG